MSAAAAAYPYRFFTFAMANPKAWRAEAFSDVRVACLFPAMHCYSIQDEPARAVFEAPIGQSPPVGRDHVNRAARLLLAGDGAALTPQVRP